MLFIHKPLVNRAFTFLLIILYAKFGCCQRADNKNSKIDIRMDKNDVLSGVDESYDHTINDIMQHSWMFEEHALPGLKPYGTNGNVELQWTMSAEKLQLLINPNVYNKLQTPGQLIGATTEIDVGLYIESMSTFRAQTMDFEMDMYLMLSWIDHRLKHNSSHPILVIDNQIANGMWQPDLYFVNSKFAYMHKVTMPNFMTLVYPDGNVMKSTRISVTSACTLKLQDFPMDQQNCSVFVQSYAFVENVVKVVWHHGENDPIQFNPDIKISDMDRTAVTVDRCDGEYPLFRGFGKWSCLQGIITMKRKLQFHAFQIFIPSGMLVVMSWLSFWLDIRASPARISLTITTLLTLTTMSNGSRQELPQVPYMKANDIWFTVCQGFVFGVLLEFTLVNLFLGWAGVKKKSKKKKKYSSSDGAPLATFPLLQMHETEAADSTKTTLIKDYEKYARRVDTVAKILFPMSFGLFNGLYWSFYLSQT